MPTNISGKEVTVAMNKKATEKLGNRKYPARFVKDLIKSTELLASTATLASNKNR